MPGELKSQAADPSGAITITPPVPPIAAISSSTARAAVPASSPAQRIRAAIAAGRRPDDIKILFAIQPVITASAEEADRIVAASAHPDDEALRQIARKQSSDLETDLTALDLDRPLDPSFFGEHVSRGSIQRLLGDRGDDAAKEAAE